MFEDFRIRIFMEVASEGSFTKAAKNLGVSQPAVSQNVSELEKTLGVQLFERMRGEVALTDAGKAFRGYAENILHWYHAAGDVFASKGKSAQSLTIVSHPFISSYILPDVISVMRSGGDYRFDIREVSGGDEDLSISMKMRTDGIDFEGVNSLIGTVQAVILCSQRTRESFDRKKKFLESAPLAVWSEYEQYLPLDLRSRIAVKSYSIESLSTIVEKSTSLVGILPTHNNLTQGLEVISYPLPYLQMDIHIKAKDEVTLNSALCQSFIKTIIDSL